MLSTTSGVFPPFVHQAVDTSPVHRRWLIIVILVAQACSATTDVATSAGPPAAAPPTSTPRPIAPALPPGSFTRRTLAHAFTTHDPAALRPPVHLPPHH